MARVLHIEDDPNNRLLVRKLLRAVGHEVIDAATGLAGVHLADTEHPDLVLVDINIPDLDGYEVILRLRGTPGLDGVPIVAITAEGDRQASLAVGADGFIPKPIDARTFAATLGKFLEGHREVADDTGAARLRERSQRIVERLEHNVEELREANRRLEEMARLRQEFLQNVSHELATPMTPVVGYVRLLLAEELGPLTPLQRKCLESVQSSTQRLRSVVDTLLDVSSLDSGRMHFYVRNYELGECLERALTDVAPLARDTDVTILRPDLDRAIEARGDPDKLVRGLVHVLDNAVKFAGKGGRVALDVEVEPDALEIRVADSGPGVPPEQIAKITEPFYQVDGSPTRRHGGVGLGLAFARRVCEALGGSIRIESPPSIAVAGEKLQGTLVRLRVALDPPPPERRG
jgi:signal transduction histidine kinase